MKRIIIVILLISIVAINCRPQGNQQEDSIYRISEIQNQNERKLENVPREDEDLDDDDEEELQNQNAKYEFSSDIEDHINDLSQHRQETRDGQTVKGSYSYSDGYYKITVAYIADKDGYRVTGMESLPLTPDGPHVDLEGIASVSNKAHGSELNYRIKGIQTTEAPQELKKRKFVVDTI